MKKIIIILTLIVLGGCATSSRQQIPDGKYYDLLHTVDSYAEKSPTIEDLMKKDFN
jgi:uncharacterized protein YceK